MLVPALVTAVVGNALATALVLALVNVGLLLLAYLVVVFGALAIVAGPSSACSRSSRRRGPSSSERCPSCSSSPSSCSSRPRSGRCSPRRGRACTGRPSACSACSGCCSSPSAFRASCVRPRPTLTWAMWRCAGGAPQPRGGRPPQRGAPGPVRQRRGVAVLRGARHAARFGGDPGCVARAGRSRRMGGGLARRAGAGDVGAAACGHRRGGVLGSLLRGGHPRRSPLPRPVRGLLRHRTAGHIRAAGGVLTGCCTAIRREPASSAPEERAGPSAILGGVRKPEIARQTTSARDVAWAAASASALRFGSGGKDLLGALGVSPLLFGGRRGAGRGLSHASSRARSGHVGGTSLPRAS